MHIAHLARANKELLAPLFEDKLRFVFREHVGGAVVLLRQLLLPFHDFTREANDDVVFIGLSVNCDGAEFGVFDLHGLILALPSLRNDAPGATALSWQTDRMRAAHLLRIPPPVHRPYRRQ